MNIVHREGVPEFVVKSVEGKQLPLGVRARILLHGTYGLMIEVHNPKGMRTPRHSHTHESFLYVVSGKVRATVGDEIGIALAGDAILHPAGVEHVSEAVEESVWIEVKAPPQETW